MYVLNRPNNKSFQLMLVSHWLIQGPIKLACLPYTMEDNRQGNNELSANHSYQNQDVKNILTSFHFCDIFSLKYSSQQESILFTFKNKIPVFKKKKNN